MIYKTISCYKYIPIEDPASRRDSLRALCENLHLLGRILVGTEGINAAICGKEAEIGQFKQILTQNPSFADLTFREQNANTQTYHKLVVRVRSEIVSFGVPVDLSQKGIPLPPAILQQWYEQNEDFIIVDARNEVEYTVGKFRNAFTLPIKTFREFPEHTSALEPFKSKKIVLYCTGGIRCEKASAYLKGQGFEQVYQLAGGIINYLTQFPVAPEKITSRESCKTYWEGGLFVFDDRIVQDVAEAITACQFCGMKSEKYSNCHNLDCDRLFIGCYTCLQKMEQTCSKQCREAPRQRKEHKVSTWKAGGP